jgi:hypothetical protein
METHFFHINYDGQDITALAPYSANIPGSIFCDILIGERLRVEPFNKKVKVLNLNGDRTLREITYGELFQTIGRDFWIQPQKPKIQRVGSVDDLLDSAQ